MKTNELREAYLKFFETKGCVRRPSDVLVPHGDPTVLFTPAGMNQFKDQFLGIGKLEFTRATTCQKCLRTGDIENVGKTPYHHTFFEMLGNFSFGDYFKREAIQWAWEFLTAKEWMSVDPGRITVSVYLDDDEAYGIWHKLIGLAPERIQRMGEEDNFWPAGAPSHGPDGVCGPCSEIFVHTPKGGDVEVWNLVFTQFNRVGPPPNNLRPLPKKNIDTGMGLERMAAVMQGVESNFETDHLLPIVACAAELAGVRYAPGTADKNVCPSDELRDALVRLRRIADHARAVTFCIHENVFPSNTKQGAVVRKLLRRAVLDGYLLGLREPFVHRVVPEVVEQMRVPYPELVETEKRVADRVKLEEEQFLDTLDRGMAHLERLFRRLEKEGRRQIADREAFELHTTYGFPIDLTVELAAEHGRTVDRAGFQKLMQQHAEVSGADYFAGEVFKLSPLAPLKETMHGSEFLGYETCEAEAEVKGIFLQFSSNGKVVMTELLDHLERGPEKPTERKDLVVLVLDRTPFYGEAGGQVGDTGVIEGPGWTFRVVDTQREDGFVKHVGYHSGGRITLGDRVTARVDAERRAGIRRAHSATHLLHWALRKVLGTHAQQAGSKVDHDWLRFDFSHPQAVRPEELRQIEDDVNRRIGEASPVRWQYMPLAEARRSGAMALFGEKYPDTVRVVAMGGDEPFSRELCGGTHLDNTAQVGLLKIVSEESVAAGTRRIVALTGPKALEHIRREEEALREACDLLRAYPAELPRRVEALLSEIKELKKELGQARQRAATASTDDLLDSAVEVAGVKVLAREMPEADAAALRWHIDQLRRRTQPLAVLLGARGDGKVLLIAGLTRDLVERGLDAVDWVKSVARHVQGGGGGRPDLAQAGGKEPAKLPEALVAAVQYVRERLR